MGLSPEQSCLPLLTTPLAILAGSLKNLAGRGWGKGGRVGQEGNVTTGVPLNSFPKATPLPRYAVASLIRLDANMAWCPGFHQFRGSVWRTCVMHVPCISCAALVLSCPAPDINPAWYTGRGIRPVGRFGRRRAALRDVTVPGLRCRLSCLPLEGGAELSQHE